jgi:peptidoglycan/LPS O-acetylase OafA/YrhL
MELNRDATRSESDHSLIVAGCCVNPIVEGFRFLAALMVVAHHYSYLVDDTLTRGWLHFFHTGVDLFFVITGFLFAPYLLGEVQQSVKAFAIRRAFRLYPLYLMSIAVAVLKDWGEREGMGVAVVKHLFFLQALPIFDLANVGFFSLIYWTLPVEVMFYALVALALVYFRSPGRKATADGRATTLVRQFGAMAALGFLLVYLTGFDPNNEVWVIWQAQLPALLVPFWFGMLIHFSRSTLEQSLAWRWIAHLLGGALLVALYFAYPHVAQSGLTARPFGFFNLLSGLGYALILAGSLSFADGLKGTSARWIVFAGSLSYGIYLFHEWTLKVVLRILPQLPPLFQVAIAAVGVVLFAAILHRTAEAPLRAYGRSLAARFANDSPALKTTTRSGS